MGSNFQKGDELLFEPDTSMLKDVGWDSVAKSHC